MLLTDSQGTTFANTFEAWEYFGHDVVPIASVSAGRPKPKYRGAMYLGREQALIFVVPFSVGGKSFVAGGCRAAGLCYLAMAGHPADPKE
jgi:hypothetical protein